MHEVEVDILQPQGSERTAKGFVCLALSLVFWGEFGGDEEVGAWDGAVSEGTANFFLVAVDGGGVDVSVTPLTIIFELLVVCVSVYMCVYTCACGMLLVSTFTDLECLCHGGIACFTLDLESA